MVVIYTPEMIDGLRILPKWGILAFGAVNFAGLVSMAWLIVKMQIDIWRTRNRH